MGLNWKLIGYMAAHGVEPDDLAARLPYPLPETWLSEALPEGLAMADLAVLCQALGCQPGDLLTFTPETPAEIAERELARNLSYQSFLAFQSAHDEPSDA